MTNTVARLLNVLGWSVGLAGGLAGLLLLLCAFATPVTAADTSECLRRPGALFMPCADLDASRFDDLRRPGFGDDVALGA